MMSVSSESKIELLNKIKELENKLSFMEFTREEKTDTNELDYIKLKIEFEKIRKQFKSIEARYNLINLQPHLGLVYFDTDQTVIDCNEKFTKIIGLSREELVGHSVFNVFENKNLLLSIKKTLKGTSAIFEGEHYNKKEKIKLFLRGYFISGKSLENSEPINAGIFEDITETKKTENNFKLLTQSFKKISEGVIITDSQNFITYVNDAFTDIYGYNREEILGKNIGILSSLNNPKKITERIYSVSRKKNWEGKLLNIKKDGTEFTVYFSISSMANTVSGEYSHIAIVKDITKDKKIEEELIAAKEKAEQSDKLKSEFLGQMSHEIRTPINIILNVSNMILEDHYFETDEDTRSTFSILDSAGKRIIRTIDLILNMSEAQVGAYNLSLRKFDLFGEMYNSFYNEFLRLAEDKDLDFFWKKETANTTVLGDIYSISQIFDNILHNAIKYTHIGEIKVKFYENKKGNLVVKFIDTGIGISEEFLGRIFEPFSQEDSGDTRRYEGNGLGLALSKVYCDLNNIKIDVKSKKGFGTTFKLTFTNR